MKKIPVLKISVLLMAVGVAITLVGFIWSGANIHAYEPYAHRWYSVVHLGD